MGIACLRFPHFFYLYFTTTKTRKKEKLNMKKIPSNFYKNVADFAAQERTLDFSLGGEDFQVKIKEFLTKEQKVELFQDTLTVLGTQGLKEESEELKSMVVIMVIFKALTDIEFPEEPTAQIEQFTALLEVGIADDIFAAFREGLVENTALFLKEAIEVASEQVKEGSKKEIQENSPEV